MGRNFDMMSARQRERQLLLYVWMKINLWKSLCSKFDHIWRCIHPNRSTVTCEIVKSERYVSANSDVFLLISEILGQVL